MTPEIQRAQSARCSCRGADDYCPCQNAPDAVTRRGMTTVPARDEDEAQRGLNDIFPGDPYPVASVLRAIRQRSVQAIGAGLSRRDWHATETAYNELRDKMDDLLRRLVAART